MARSILEVKAEWNPGQSWMESHAKLNEKYLSFGTLYFKFCRYFLYKKYKIKLVYQFLNFLLFYIASEFTLGDITFTTF